MSAHAVQNQNDTVSITCSRDELQLLEQALSSFEQQNQSNQETIQRISSLRNQIRQTMPEQKSMAAGVGGQR